MKLSTQYPHRWHFIYLRGKAEDLLNGSIFFCDKPKPTRYTPGFYLVEIHNNPAMMILFADPRRLEEGYVVLLNDIAELHRVLKINKELT